jgi:hypothetical protein
MVGSGSGINIPDPQHCRRNMGCLFYWFSLLLHCAQKYTVLVAILLKGEKLTFGNFLSNRADGFFRKVSGE